MTDKLREAAQQALEALEHIEHWYMSLPKSGLDSITALRAALAEQPAEQEPVAWMPIATAPKGRIVLVHYKNSLGNGRTMRARYYLPETLDSDTTESGWADEGWYEESEAYEYLMPLEHDPTHWMPLPAGPDTAPQPAKPAEPVAWMYFDSDGDAIFGHPNGYRPDDAVPVYTSPQPAKPAEQEPEGSVCGRCGGLVFDPVLPQPAVPSGYKLVPVSALQWLFGEVGEFECPTNLYFRGKPAPFWWRSVFRELIESAPEAPQPAKREPLTDEEIAALWLDSISGPLTATKFARAIEAAHGINVPQARGETK